MERKFKFRDGFFTFLFTRIVTPATILYCLVSFVSSRYVIAQKELELEKIQEKIEQYQLENAELKRVLDSTDLDEYMADIATENPELNYGIPNEKRFYDLSKN
ncbi:MAG: hypothetical protein LBR54_02465 [Oscillospiraceae bacterium]|jgi:cell division protein FtsL|nr:hypothetical protein [Oscillospiraceae bacterium]